MVKGKFIEPYGSVPQLKVFGIDDDEELKLFLSNIGHQVDAYFYIPVEYESLLKKIGINKVEYDNCNKGFFELHIRAIRVFGDDCDSDTRLDNLGAKWSNIVNGYLLPYYTRNKLSDIPTYKALTDDFNDDSYY